VTLPGGNDVRSTALCPRGSEVGSRVSRPRDRDVGSVVTHPNGSEAGRRAGMLSNGTVVRYIGSRAVYLRDSEVNRNYPTCW
jgi:hypothetical protein